jgi:hypothetical protein
MIEIIFIGLEQQMMGFFYLKMIILMFFFLSLPKVVRLTSIISPLQDFELFEVEL